jgi:hypothetical protein
MSAILRSLKSDLLDRRLLPILLLLGLALAGAVAYVVLDGGGSSPSGAAPSSAAIVPAATPSASGPALPVSQAPTDPNAAVAETTNGARYQHKAGSHDPFTPLQGKAAAVTPSSSGSSSSAKSSSSPENKPGSSTKTSSSTSSTPSSSTPSGGSPSTPPVSTQVAPKPKPKPVYLVTVQFGRVSSVPGVLPQLTPYPDLKHLQELPSSDDTLIVFGGARANGKGALFALSREAILKGQADCIPSASQCEVIDLAPGDSEELTYLEPDGESVPYELKVVSIELAKSQAAAARARAARRHRHRHG